MSEKRVKVCFNCTPYGIEIILNMNKGAQNLEKIKELISFLGKFVAEIETEEEEKEEKSDDVKFWLRYNSILKEERRKK